jgi:RNA polymerase sigma-70 factor, ECF subfamily
MGDTGMQSAVEAAAPSAGDFAGWVGPHLGAMRLFATRLAPGAQDDVVQDALVRAWRRKGTFDPSRGSARTWLLALVAGEARRTRIRLRRPSVEPVPTSRSVDLERDLDVQHAVGSLPKRMRLAVELHYFVGLSVIETAQVMGVSEGTAKSTLHDARERLRPVLGVQTKSEGR